MRDGPRPGGVEEPNVYLTHVYLEYLNLQIEMYNCCILNHGILLYRLICLYTVHVF